MKPTLQGIAASDGIAIAKVYTLTEPDLTVTKVTVEDSEKEVSRLDDALAASIKDVELIKETALKNLGEEEAQVFDAHLMVLSDPELIGQVKDSITSNKVNAESALKEVTDMFISIFAGMEDNPYMQERAADIRDVSKRVLAHLLGGGFISLIGTMTDMFNGKVNTSISNLVMQAFTDPNHATKQAMSLVNSFESGSKLAVLFYIVACAAAIVTSYFYYQKLFQKKD